MQERAVALVREQTKQHVQAELRTLEQACLAREGVLVATLRAALQHADSHADQLRAEIASLRASRAELAAQLESARHQSMGLEARRLFECKLVLEAATADSAEALAANAVSLYQDEREWQKLSDRGRRLIAARFDFSIHAPRLCAALKQVMADVTAHRQQHFYGMMLRHHSLKSTQYMAQWIEAKNRLKQENPS